MKKHLCLLIFLIPLFTSAQYFTEPFLNDDLENRTFKLISLNKEMSEKQLHLLTETWSVGKMMLDVPEDTTTADYVVLPAPYITKETFNSLLVCKPADLKKLNWREDGSIDLTEDSLVKAMVVLPSSMVEDAPYTLLFKVLESTLRRHKRELDLPLFGKSSLMSLKKGWTGSSILFHWLCLDSEWIKADSKDFQELSGVKAKVQVAKQTEDEQKLEENRILIYPMTLPPSFKRPYFLCILNTEFGALHVEPLLKTKQEGRLDQQLIKMVLDALHDKEASLIFQYSAED